MVAVVRCAGCERVLNEPSDLPFEERKPCPGCRSTGRTFEVAGAGVIGTAEPDGLGYDYDVFVSHASEDKDGLVRPLVEAMTRQGLAVWYDETELVPGVSLIETVERGLSRSRFGVIVLSKAFFVKNWPRKELNVLASRELATGESVLIPIWLDVTEADVRRYSPLLADRWAIRSDVGLDEVARRVCDRVVPDQPSRPTSADLRVVPDQSSRPTSADLLDEERRRRAEFESVREERVAPAAGPWNRHGIGSKFSRPLPTLDHGGNTTSFRPATRIQERQQSRRPCGGGEIGGSSPPPLPPTCRSN